MPTLRLRFHQNSHNMSNHKVLVKQTNLVRYKLKIPIKNELTFNIMILLKKVSFSLHFFSY